jgi:hypothetical protein
LLVGLDGVLQITQRDGKSSGHPTQVAPRRVVVAALDPRQPRRRETDATSELLLAEAFLFAESFENSA